MNKSVYIHRCSKCGLEYNTFRESKPVSACTRCGNTFLACRRIENPHPDMVAACEDAEVNAYRWARDQQSFDGTREDWDALSPAERRAYEDGAAGLGTA